MKTAISLPDPLFKRIDWLAKWFGISRSELIARALDDYLARHEGDAVTESLNRIYDGEDAGLPADARRAQQRWIKDEGW